MAFWNWRKEKPDPADAAANTALPEPTPENSAADTLPEQSPAQSGPPEQSAPAPETAASAALAEPAPPERPEPAPDQTPPAFDQAQQGQAQPDPPAVCLSQPPPAPADPQISGQISDPDAGRSRWALWGERLGLTRQRLSGAIDRLALSRKIDDDLLEELEEILVTSDLGMKTSLELIEGLRKKVQRKELADAEALKAALRADLCQLLARMAPPRAWDAAPHVIMVVGVNGVGKTTTIGKLAHYYKSQGLRPLLAAGDTFRAAAAEQLEIWAQRTGSDLVRQQAGADPSAVAYDALDAALSRKADLVIVDTAGRLHTKINLMDELKKIHRVMDKRLPGAPHDVWLVLDATTGQNALNQARLFHEATPLSGIILTKLDGTAKGGVVVAIAAELGLPIIFTGLGEGLNDLKPFDPQAFARAII